MLRKLLHERTWAKAFELNGMPVMRRHKNHIRLRIDKDGTIETETECSDTDSDDETDTTETYTSSSCTDDGGSNRIIRQDAMDRASPRTVSMGTSSCSSNFGYVRYFDQSTDMHFDISRSPVRGDCTKDIFASVSSESLNKFESKFAQEIKDSSRCNKLYPGHFMQHSESTDDSCINLSRPRPYMACEDLVNIDDDAYVQNLGGLDGDFELTRRSYSNCNECPKGLPVKPWKSTEEHYSRDKSSEIEARSEPNISETANTHVLLDLDPPSPQRKNFDSCSDAPINVILDPPPMFRNEDEALKIININPNKSIPFRKHSINSDKRLRRSVTKSMLEYGKIESDQTDLSGGGERLSNQSEKSKSRKCDCCNRSTCHSPRSSDSGVVGSCNLASPELNMHEVSGPGHDLDNRKKSITSDDIKFSTVDICPESYNISDSEQLTYFEMEAATFEDQCRCTSPFGSTPRTSCKTNSTSDNVLVGNDSSRTSVTSTYMDSPVSSHQQTRKMQRTSLRADINQHLLVTKKPEPPPRLYRQPSAHLEVPKNVRQPIISHGWSTININEPTKPSLHYHMRVYRENTKVNDSSRQSRKETLRNCELFNNQSTEIYLYGPRVRQNRSRSEDLSKFHKSTTGTQTGFMVYRSDLYAHWWMKAKLPITVVSDSGKDHYFVKEHCFV